MDDSARAAVYHETADALIEWAAGRFLFPDDIYPGGDGYERSDQSLEEVWIERRLIRLAREARAAKAGGAK